MKKALTVFITLSLIALLCCSCGKTKTYIAEITVENYGVITVELDAKTAPITVANFVKLANEGFYDGLTFHRIMPNFMIQGGSPNGTNTGGSSETIKGEFSANGVKNNISHVRGAISMARNVVSPYYPEEYQEAARNSASSQFFIMHEDYTDLDGDYAAFGHVISGMEVVDAICEDAEPTDGNGTIPADKQPVITSIKIIEE